MDQEVAKTLGELELKLQELERELTSIGRRDSPAEPPGAPGKLIDEAVERDGAGETGSEPRAEETASVDGDAFGGPAVFGGEEVPSRGGATIERDWTVDVRETAYGEIPTPPSPTPPSPPAPPSSPLPPPQAPLPAPTPQPTPSTPPGPPPPSTPPGPPPPTNPPGMHPPTTPGRYPPSTPPGSHPSPPHRPDPRHPAAVEESQSVDLPELVRFRDKLARTMDELIEEYSRLLPVDPSSRPRPGA
jgi:hypothetical protein